ncbi:MAG: YggS family pyridoxal phosphate-dependent enzyme [Proteobacteria bacterium]|nr:YggS family pyridoxal phosphate-dependent enzyme [Pseudomonadota bacterium]
MSIQSRLNRIREQIRQAEEKLDCSSSTSSVSLLAISKTHPVSKILEAIAAGQHSFGENYLQEALEKIHTLSAEKIEWHFVGAVQSNKTKALAENFSWVHGVTRVDIAKKLNQYRPKNLPPLNICIQVNISGEGTKSGVAPEQVFLLAKELLNFPMLRLRGLMTIPAPLKTDEEQHQAYQAMQQIYKDLKKQGVPLDTLSMGMSDDFQIAIAHGATLVRIGTAIFGSREGRKNHGP